MEEPFAIINADDYYGVSAFATILQELLALPPVGQGTMVGYRLKNTVSDNGTVSRRGLPAEGREAGEGEGDPED